MCHKFANAAFLVRFYIELSRALSIHSVCVLRSGRFTKAAHHEKHNTASPFPQCTLPYTVEAARVHSCGLAVFPQVLHRPPKGHQGINTTTRLPGIDVSSQNLRLPHIFSSTGGCD